MCERERELLALGFVAVLDTIRTIERERERERQLLALGFVAVLDTIRTYLLHVLLNSVKFKLFYNRGTGQNFTTVL